MMFGRFVFKSEFLLGRCSLDIDFYAVLTVEVACTLDERCIKMLLRNLFWYDIELLSQNPLVDPWYHVVYEFSFLVTHQRWFFVEEFELRVN